MSAISIDDQGTRAANLGAIEIVGSRDNISKIKRRGTRHVMTVAIEPRKYITSIRHPLFRGGVDILVANYDNRADAFKGHAYWERRFFGRKRLPDTVTDVNGQEHVIARRPERD